MFEKSRVFVLICNMSLTPPYSQSPNQPIMQQNIPFKCVPKLTECVKACLDEQNKVSKKQRNDEKGGEEAPKKA
jgi:hypothetical protein